VSHQTNDFCECLQLFIYKGDIGLAYEISPMYRESLEVHGSCEAVLAPKAPARGQGQQRATFIQVFVCMFLADDGV
jgi:hypothetical protein